MTSHPLLVAEEIAFRTILLPKPELNDAISVQIGKWANVPFDPNPDALNDAFYECEKVFNSEQIIRNFVHCTQQMMFKQNVTAHEIVVSTFRRNKESFSYNQLAQCHLDYLVALNREINTYAVFTGQEEDVIAYEDAYRRKAENKKLMLELQCLSPENFLELDDVAKNADNLLFATKTLALMEKAKTNRLIPRGYKL